MLVNAYLILTLILYFILLYKGVKPVGLIAVWIWPLILFGVLYCLSMWMLVMVLFLITHHLSVFISYVIRSFFHL